MSPRNIDPELRALVDAALDGTIGDTEHERLADLLDRDEDAREYYTDMIQMHATLLWEHATPLEHQSSVGPAAGDAPPPRALRLPRYAIAALLAIAVGGLVVIAIQSTGVMTADPDPRLAQSDDDASQLAVLTDVTDAVWSPDSAIEPINVGQALPSGALRLKSGKAQLLFQNGAVVQMIGPSELAMTSDHRCRLSHGSIVVRVPKTADGFVVDTPNLVVTDLGTAFGVTVDPESEEVHVFEGRVRVDRLGTAGQVVRSVTLGENDAVRMDGTRQLVGGFANRTAFGASGLPALRSRYERAVLRDEPLAYWPLTDRAFDGNRVLDLSGNGYHGVPRGAVDWTRAAPTGPRTLTMGRDGYVDVGRDPAFRLTQAFSVEAWIYLDYEQPYGRIISADADGPAAGWGLGYQGPKSLTEEGSIFFTTYRILDFRFTATIPMQKWAHIAVVFDQRVSRRFEFLEFAHGYRKQVAAALLLIADGLLGEDRACFRGQ